MAEILGKELQPTQTDKGVYYADHCRTLASAAVAEGRRILIVLDGIDEALGGRFSARWFPRNPGTSMRLVLSARWQAGDLDSSGWKTRLGWDRDVRVESRELPVLARKDVRDLLIKMGAPTNVLASRPDIVDRLYDLSEGEPLVLRYYAEDIWSMGATAPRLTLDDLAQMRPGLGAYFERWLNEQDRLWEEVEDLVDRQRVDAILAILACAHGRLKGADLQALLTEDGDTVAGGRFLGQLKPIQRFVIGLDRPETETAGYILSHPKLGTYLREEYFDREYIQETQAAFVRWGRKTVARLNRGALRPEETPAYLVQYHTQHLLDTGASADVFFELVEEGWLRAWETFEGGYGGFSRDVRLAYEALSRAHAADQPRYAQRLRCQLVLSSINSIGVHMPMELLVAAFKAGVLTYRQVAHWLEFQSFYNRVDALGALAPHLPVEQRAEMLSKELKIARAIEDSFWRARALSALAPSLPVDQRAEVLAETLTAARALEDNKVSYAYAPEVLGALAPYLPAELLPEALRIARAIEDSRWRARALSALAPSLPVEQRAEVLAEALTAARALEDNKDRYALPEVLGALAPHLPAELLPEALASARAIARSDDRAQVLGALALHMEGELQAEVMADALQAARAIQDSGQRGGALSALAPHLPGELLPEALVAARAIEDSFWRARALSALAPHLPGEQRAEVLAEALTAARAIQGNYFRVCVFNELMPHLEGELRAEVLAEALTAARAIQENNARAYVFDALALHLEGKLRAEVLAEALQAARAIQGNYFRVCAFGTLAPHLEGELRAEVLAEALQAAWEIEASDEGDSENCAEALGELAPHLPAELLPEALRMARAIQDNDSRVYALGALVPHLEGELQAEVMADALQAARAIQDNDSRVYALGALVPHLEGELRAEVMADTLQANRRSVAPSTICASRLGALAPQLSGSLLQQGFEDLLDLLPRYEIDNSLSAVTSFFPFLEECQGLKGLEEMRRTIIDIARWFP